MKKKKYNISIVTTLTLLVVAFLLFIVYFFCLQAPKDYLSEKYNIPKNELTAVFMSPKKHEKEKAFFWDECEKDYWVPTQWTYKYNDRFFHVEYYDGYYVDDYQLDDLWQWSVDYLKENVDSRIDGIQLFESDLYNSIKNDNGSRLKSENKYSAKVWKKEEIDVFLAQLQGVMIYYSVDSLSYYTFEVESGYRVNNKYYELSDELSKIATTVLGSEFSIGVVLHERPLTYKRLNTYRRFGAFNYSSAYGIKKEWKQRKGLIL